MTIIQVSSATRFDTYHDENIDVLALRFGFDQPLVTAVGDILRSMKVFCGTWDKQERFWWCFPWAWEMVRERFDEADIAYDDSAVDAFFAPPHTRRQRQQETPPPPKQAAKPQPYEVLGVSITADETEIRAAYLRLVKQWHPDRIPSDLAPELRAFANRQMAAINVAYDAYKSRFAKAQR